MWRYRAVLPLRDGEQPVSLGEGVTPLHRAAEARARDRRRAAVGQGRRTQSDRVVQGARHERRRHARRGAAACRASSCRRRATPARRSPRTARPRDFPCASTRRAARRRRSSRRSARSAPICSSSTDTSAMPASRRAPSPRSTGYFDVSTLREPYRIEGKKTMGTRARRAARLDAADAHHLSDRRRHGADRHVEGVRARCATAAGCRRTSRLPRMIVAQADGCAPIVRAFEAGRDVRDAVGESAHARQRPARARPAR